MKTPMEQWIAFYDANGDDVALEDADFESLAIGFFLGVGCTIDQAKDLWQECIRIGKF